MNYIDGAQVGLQVNQSLFEATTKQPDLLVVYMGNYATYVLENRNKGESEDVSKAQLYAFEALIKSYKSKKTVGLGNEIEALNSIMKQSDKEKIAFLNKYRKK